MNNIKTAARAKRRFLSLIEILIVLSIIAMLGGFVAINVRGALSEQHFKNDVQKVTEQIRLTRQLMLISSVDTELVFKEGNLHFVCENKIEPRIDRMIRKKMPLDHIKSVTFDGHADPTLLFKSRGSIVPTGTLVLKGGNGEVKSLYFDKQENQSWDPLIEVIRSEITETTSNPS